MKRIPASYWLAGLALAWLLSGLIGHAPWKGPDAETFADLLAARAQGNWLLPENAGMPPLYLWLAQGLATVLSPPLPLHDAARLASGVFAGIALWCTALAARRLYGELAGWPAVLALMGCLGLLVPAHETNPYTAQLAAMALFAYGLTRMLTQPLTGGGLAGLGLAGLFLSGAWLPALALAAALLLLPLLFPSWRTSARVGGSWFALIAAAALAGVWLLTAMAKQPKLFADWWQHALGHFVFAAGKPGDYNPLYFVNALSWFAWPAWPLAGWAVYRLRRGGWDSVRLWLPLGMFAVALLALSVQTGTEQLQSIILLPALALLAAAGLGELRRGAANALLWFGFMAFSFFALVFWLYWSAFDLGWPAQMARRLARLGMESQGLRPLALALGLLFSVAWAGWLLWLKNQPRSPLRPILVWNAGITFLWALLLALFMQPLDKRLSYAQVGREIGIAAAGANCIAAQNLGEPQRLLLAYHSGLDFQAADSARCDWRVLLEKHHKAVAPGPGWRKQWEGGRPRERNERFLLYRREP